MFIGNGDFKRMTLIFTIKILIRNDLRDCPQVRKSFKGNIKEISLSGEVFS